MKAHQSLLPFADTLDCVFIFCFSCFFSSIKLSDHSRTEMNKYAPHNSVENRVVLKTADKRHFRHLSLYLSHQENMDCVSINFTTHIPTPSLPREFFFPHPL